MINACLFHKPIYVYNVVRNPRKQQVPASTMVETGEVMHQPNPHRCGHLQRTIWKDGYTVQSILAKEIERHQTNCSL
jgi:hypothetical protein